MILTDTALPREGILAMVEFRPHEGLEQQCLEAIRKLYDVIRRKNYGRDLLLRDVKAGCWIAVRFWASEEARRNAQEDPEVLRLWEVLGRLCTVERVREQLEKIELGR